MESKLLLYSVLESLSLFQSETISFGNDGDNVYSLAELLEDDNVNGLEGVARRLNEEQAAVDSGVLDVAVALGGEFFAQVCRVLVLDVLDNWIPAAVVVNKVAVARGVDDVQT